MWFYYHFHEIGSSLSSDARLFSGIWNIAGNLKKKQKTIKKVCLDNDEEKIKFEIPDFASNPYQRVIDKELEKAIKNSIHKLPDPFKAAIIMRELQGLSYEEIARATNSNIGTVKSRIARARLKLQEYLKPYIS